MVTVYDVPAEQLILKTAQKLKENPNIVPPEWAEYVKTGRHTEKAPSQDDWWYTRAASIMRKLYVKGPMGSSKLAAEYGGYADKGSMPNRAVKGSRNIARKCMRQPDTLSPRTSRVVQSAPQDSPSWTTLRKRFMTR